MAGAVKPGLNSGLRRSLGGWMLVYGGLAKTFHRNAGRIACVFGNYFIVDDGDLPKAMDQIIQ
eukprot:CAMPEP_0170438368 /NCGR_PEP_ID=MMETSP0117_2-20130122/45195_1 /TAXON_ID=400756 /ORGANISM="Durinskia baltica, Strain CSIRO CS-38" /LENGTH=62 /DNA_ID=CAMNT_0010698581 /DNA_START=193 /DNA_END=378 /DNA_ORIENTATION=-